MSDGSFSHSVKEAIKNRASGRCDICGITVHNPHYHHRNARGMGGTSLGTLGLPSNGMLLHPKCHERVESYRWSSMQSGWLITGFDNAEEIPVRLWDGWHYLLNDGTLAVVPPEDIPELSD